MDIMKELNDLMESCGGEDLIRYLLKDDGVIDWETITLNPIVAYSPNHMDRAMICGIAYWNGYDFQIIHSEETFDNNNLQELVNSVSLSQNFEFGAEALLSLNRAIIATPDVIETSRRMSWEAIVLEVIYGYRSNNYTKHINTTTRVHNLSSLGNLFDILMGVKEGFQTNITKPIPKGVDFSDEFKSEWA